MAHRTGSAYDPGQPQSAPPRPPVVPALSSSSSPPRPRPLLPLAQAPQASSPPPSRLYPVVPPPPLPPPPALPPPLPPPSMQSIYSSYPPSSGPGADPHHAPPSGLGLAPGLGPHASPLSPINLPPIRSIDAASQLPALASGGPSRYPSQIPLHQQHQQQQPPAAQYAQPSYYAATPLPPLPPAAQQPPQHHHLAYGAPVQQQPASAFYQQPPRDQDQRLMSGGRHKKEIKRRTKTGCLTCRKRRIKCDEAHPTCRNCEKSKRECLGYDPIFKQQTSPAQLQPAPLPPLAGQDIMALPPAPQLSINPQSYSVPGGGLLPLPGGPHHSSAYNLVDPTLSPSTEAISPTTQTARGQGGPLVRREQPYPPPYDRSYPQG